MSEFPANRAPDRMGDPEIHESLFSRFMISVAKRSTRGRSYNFMRVLAIGGRLHAPYLIWNSRVMPKGKLPRKQTEAVIIRTAWLCGSEYEWVQHKAIGRGVGLTEEQVEAAGPEPGSKLFDAQTCAMLAIVPELLENHVLSDASYEELRKFLSPNLLFELIMLVGTYSALAGALNSFGVPLEPAWEKR